MSALPRGHAYLADQLPRAADSIPLHSRRELASSLLPTRRTSSRFARRSATESAAIIDALAILELADEPLRTRARGLLRRIVAMLTAMVLKTPGSGSNPSPEDTL